MEIAIAHDYLTQRGGAERVVLALAEAFPAAPIYSLLYEPSSTFPEFRDLNVQVSALNRLPLARRYHRLTLPVLAAASRSINIKERLIIASTSGWAHGFGRLPSSRMLAYCHNPARWLYQQNEYLGKSPSPLSVGALRILAPHLKRWDQRSARSVEKYVANSTVVAERIEKTYGRTAPVVPPPIAGFQQTYAIRPKGLADTVRVFALVVSRLMPYKNVDVAIRACIEVGIPIAIVGRGPELERLRGAANEMVHFLGEVSDGELSWLYNNCNMLLGVSYEDFGLTPLEAGRYGKPTVALRGGGYLDTILGGITGVFFERPTTNDVAQAIRIAMSTRWDKGVIVAHADTFRPDRFIERISSELSSLM